MITLKRTRVGGYTHHTTADGRFTVKPTQWAPGNHHRPTGFAVVDARRPDVEQRVSRLEEGRDLIAWTLEREAAQALRHAAGITEQEYDKARSGARLVSIAELENGYGIVPAGTKLTVVSKRDGFNVVTNGCETCGVVLKIRAVPARMVNFEQRCPACSAECTLTDGMWTCTRKSCK